MTRRPLLRSTALAVALGAVAWSPTPAGAQDSAVGRVTIDGPPTVDGVVPTQQLTITGDAVGAIGLPVAEVAVTVTPLDLPGTCGGPRSKVGPVSEGRYQVDIEVVCNGQYQIDATAGALGPEAESRRIGVAERPGAPARPHAEPAPGGGLVVTWEGTTDPDSEGWIFIANSEQTPLAPDVVRRDLPPTSVDLALGVLAMRWGADGPDGTILVSDLAGWTTFAGSDETPDPKDPEPPLPPPNPNPGPGGPIDDTGDPGGPGSSSTSPPTTSGRSEPSRGVGAPSTTLPEGYSAELPYGVPDDAFVPGSEAEARRTSAADGDEESAAGTTPGAGLVRTSEKRSPGLVAPFALGLMLITVAAHIAWYLRRSRPTGNGQVMPR